MVASLPRAADYVEALQHPSECFVDPELAGATVELTPIGLPRASSGNVAVVFKLVAESGRAYAVRCFVRAFDDLDVRYRALVPRLRAPWAVPTDYRPRGIHIADEWYPVVKMAWCEATPLVAWIEAHLWDSAALSYAAMRFAALAADLRAAGVAHGDLQHGNILVAPGGALRLVDYDGMWVPELDGLRSNELGHRNYVHPRRSREDFGLHLDAFPSWVVYTSLAALSIDPLLWGRLDGGDECLLFRAADFADPDRSDAFRWFEQNEDSRLRALGLALRTQVARSVQDVTPLSPSVAPPPALALATAPAGERRDLLEVLQHAARAPLPSSAEASAEVATLLDARRAVDDDEQRAAEAFARSHADLRHREHEQLQAVDRDLREALAALVAREHELHRAEHRARAEALRTLQAAALATELGGHRLVQAKVRGLTDKVVYALALDDVRTAADIAAVVVEKTEAVVVRPDGGRVRVAGLSPDGARALAAWRQRLEARYQGELPEILPPEQVAGVSESFRAERAALDVEAQAARDAAARRVDAVRAALEAERAEHLTAWQAAQRTAAARRLELDRKLARARKDAAEARYHDSRPVPLGF